MKNIPSLIIIDEDNTDDDIITVCKRIRNNEYFDVIYVDGYKSSIKKDDVEYILNEFSKTSLEEAGKKVKGAAEDVSAKAKEIAEDISATSKEVAKNFVKFFEKLGKEIQNGIIWLKENGYWDQIVNIAQTAGKAAAIIGCKAVFPAGIALCDPIVNFIFKAIISIIEQIKKKAEENKQA